MTIHSMENMMQAGCATRRAIRLWEEHGLLGEVARSAGDTRRYTDAQLDRARIIAAAQFGGWSLAEIKQMLEAFDVDAEVYNALTTRLADQMRLAARLAEALPLPAAMRVKGEYDL